MVSTLAQLAEARRWTESLTVPLEMSTKPVKLRNLERNKQKMLTNKELWQHFPSNKMCCTDKKCHEKIRPQYIPTEDARSVFASGHMNSHQSIQTLLLQTYHILLMFMSISILLLAHYGRHLIWWQGSSSQLIYFCSNKWEFLKIL